MPIYAKLRQVTEKYFSGSISVTASDGMICGKKSGKNLFPPVNELARMSHEFAPVPVLASNEVLGRFFQFHAVNDDHFESVSQEDGKIIVRFTFRVLIGV